MITKVLRLEISLMLLTAPIAHMQEEILPSSQNIPISLSLPWIDIVHSDAVYPDPNPNGYQHKKACGTVKPASVISTSYAYNEADLSPAYEMRQCNE